MFPTNFPLDFIWKLDQAHVKTMSGIFKDSLNFDPKNIENCKKKFANWD